MFISKKKHLEELLRLEREIASLHSSISFMESTYSGWKNLYERQIEDLRRLVFIPPQVISKETLEADSVLSASEKPPEMSEAEQSAMLAGVREFDLILSGNHEMELMN